MAFWLSISTWWVEITWGVTNEASCSFFSFFYFLFFLAEFLDVYAFPHRWHLWHQPTWQDFRAPLIYQSNANEVGLLTVYSPSASNRHLSLCCP